MDNMDYEYLDGDCGLTDLRRRSCASTTVDCLAKSGICDWDSAFLRLMETAKSIGQMPDSEKTIRGLLHSFGFVMQSTYLEECSVHDTLTRLGKLGVPAVVFVQVCDRKHRGGNMVALRTDGFQFSEIRKRSQPNYLNNRRVTHVWIRFEDGIDRSPYPRQSVNRSPRPRKRLSEITETECYRFYQPNPQDNYIGDCVVRAIAGVMGVSWKTAIDLLAEGLETTVNAREVFVPVLIRKGFCHHEPITRSGKRLKGADFCKEMNRRYRNGERVFAFVGRNHVAAVVPMEGNGSIVYKMVDSWDSTSRYIGEFFVETKPKPQKAPDMTVSVGVAIKHPQYGVGMITSILNGVVSVDFGENGLHRLGEDWVSKHCTKAQGQVGIINDWI